MDSTPIVVLHGWKLDSSSYVNLKSHLLKYYTQVYVPDLPGFEEVENSQDIYTLTRYAQYLNEYFSTHKIKKATIIGHSFGGRVGIKFTAMYPNKVNELILTGVPGIRVDSAKITLFRYIAKTGKLIFTLPYLFKIGGPLRKLLYRVSGSYDYLKTNGNTRKTFLNIIEEDLVPLMDKINVPTKLIWGINDKHTPVWIARRMNKIIPHSSLVVIKDTDHSLPYKNPDIFVKHIIAASA